METKTIRFFLDYVSLYSYLAWTRLPALAARHGCEVEPVRSCLLDAHGARGPAEVPARRRYLIKDVTRLAHEFGVPFDLPPAHPFNPLLALRLSSLPMPGHQRRALVDRLFAATWAEGRAIDERGILAGIAADAGLADGALDEVATPEAKGPCQEPDGGGRLVRRLRRPDHESRRRALLGLRVPISPGSPPRR